MTRFDPTGPLPTGTAVLEASAGTGKTYAIAALAVRYIAEGVVPVDRLAVISFSRMASAELRARVRQRLRRSADVLTAHLAGTPVDPDPTDALLLDAPTEVVAERIARLHRAVSGLDSATIMTIHQFCQAMLDELGVLAEQDPRATLVEDLSLALDQVTDDVYLARYATHPLGVPFDLTTARAIARSAVGLPDADLVPAGAPGIAGERVEFADAVRTELERRKVRGGLYTFDDQLSRLRAALRGPAGVAGAERLRRRCRVVLVDEFQDTDPVQWSILHDTFAGRVPLVLIGDPKQSIYAFRGADVAAYTAAVADADERYSLEVNHRADAGIVHAVNDLFRDVVLGDGIVVPPVVASHAGSRLSVPSDSAWAAPVRLRCLASTAPVPAADARSAIIADLTGEIVTLLAGGSTVEADDGPRPVRASDIAILVSTNGRGRQIAAALTTAGVPVAFSGADSIFATSAAADWLTLLTALEQPRRSAVRAAILTDFVGADLTDLALADDDRLTGWSALLQGWSRVLAAQGVAALFATIQAPSDDAADEFAARLLRRPRGERDLTDFRHLAEVLHAQHSAGTRGQALVAWLDEAVTRSAATSDRVRRLETDRDAVQIMTVHKAKGLQFPVVLLPEAADLWVRDADEGENFAFHDGDRRVLDVGGAHAPGRPGRRAQQATEDAAERLRTLYVGCTRAQSQLTLWWARTRVNTAASPLHRLLFRRRDGLGAPEPEYPLDQPPGDGSPAALAWLAGAGIVVQDCTPERARPIVRPTAAPRRLAPATFSRRIDQDWRRTSYSGLTEAVHARPPVALVAEPITDDEPVSDPPVVEFAPGVPSPMADLPGGTGFGSLVHHVLENLDWHAPTPGDVPALAERLQEATAAAGQRWAVPGVAPVALADALLPSLLTSLGPLTDGQPLAAIPVADRLSELTFEFPLGAGRETRRLRDVAALLRRWLPADDPLAGYPAELEHPALAGQPLRGFLTGSIDSVLRVGPAGSPRFVVVDYKTNRLGPAELTLEHYTEPAMVAEMVRTHYPLQALLYCVALHRFLESRLPGYDPARHLGGVGYLFVRGMGGPGAPDTGVFRWYPPAGLVTDLSDLLADRSRS
ncbi:MAG: UvrD-helicase domain-containing protein [Propionicimonas sp.]|uniref:UvrD-helicase domain-containing protein n=1 Tax=Propionicimonas sp. TaxID=1955623 RepID=UPI003D13499E